MRKYDVALSFAGEDRRHAKRLADFLEKGGHSVFYDKYEQHELWGKDLYQHLSSVYKDRARYCVVFVSKYYAQRLWSRHELQSAQSRAFEENQEYILPVQIDETEIPGIPATVGYLDLREKNIEGIYDALVKKLAGTKSQAITTDMQNFPVGYFQSLESFESAHIKRSQLRHIYLQKYVEDSSRQKNINALEEFIEESDAMLLLIHAHGGIGKTRFALETLKRINERTNNIDILLNQGKQRVDVDEIIPEISEDTKSLIVLDDAHLIDNLRDFEKILIERDCAKLILITRSTARESVKRQLNYPMKELNLTSLDRESSIKLLKGNLEIRLLDQHVRHLGRICEENPLLIGMTTHLINTRTVKTYGDLKTDVLVKNYLKEILRDIQSQVTLDYYQPYLAFLFLLKPFSLKDANTQSLIRKLVDLNEWQEDSLLEDLEICGVLERHGDTLWLYPDLLGEHLVETTFFSDSSIPHFDKIFSKIPSSHIKRVFKTLREIVGDKVVGFLKRWARNLSTDVESQNNDERSDNLGLLQIIAPRAPEETLQIIDYLLKPESEKPPETREDWWLPTPRKHSDVLSQCLRILENPDLRYSDILQFDETLEKLIAIHFYKPEAEEYSTLRNDAFKAIVATSAHNLNLWYQGWGYSIQTKMFEKVQKWKQEDLEKYVPLILEVCRNLFQSEMRSQYVDSEGIERAEMSVAVTDELIGLRKDVISMLRLIFEEVQGPQQIEVIRVLNCATKFPELGQYEEDMKTMIRDNAEILIAFYLGLLNTKTTVTMEILQEIEKQAYHLKMWKVVDIEKIRRLLRPLQSHECYQLYRILVGDYSLIHMDDEKSLDEIQVEIAERITKIADLISDRNINEWHEKLGGFAERFSNPFNEDISRFCQLLFEIGRSKPHIAKTLIDTCISKDNALKKFSAEFIRGIRASTHPSAADTYVRQWLSSEDQMLLVQIPKTYRGIDETSVDWRDLEIFETLLNCRVGDNNHRQELDRAIMFDIRWIYKKSPEKINEMICQIVKRSDQYNINHHLHQLGWSGGQIDLAQWDLKFFEQILQALVDVSTLDYNAVNILALYGEKAPLEVVPFFERRIEKRKLMVRDDIYQYDAIPNFLKELAELYRDHPQYLEVINQILRWFQKGDYYYETAAADLISGISPDINDQLRITFLGLAKSDSAQKNFAVMEVLEKYPEDSVADELYKEIVKHSANDRELRKVIKSKIIHGYAAKLQRWRNRLNSWRTDDNEFLREFAQREIKHVESSIESHDRITAEDEIKRKKGLL